MRKITGIFLILVMLLPCISFVGCGAEPNLGIIGYFMKSEYINQLGLENMNPLDVVIDYYGGNYNGALIVMLDAEHHSPEMWTEYIQSENIKITYYDSNRLHAYYNGRFYTITEAFENNIISSKDLRSILYHFSHSVGHFRDTCDKYDFSYKFYVWDNFESYESETPRMDIVGIQVDTALTKHKQSSISSSDLISYLGEDLFEKCVNQFHGDDSYVCLAMKLKNPGYENMQVVFEHLSHIPGVISAGYYYDFYYPFD